jgi:hypothetical protein
MSGKENVIGLNSNQEKLEYPSANTKLADTLIFNPQILL